MSPAIAGTLRITGGLQAIDLSPKFFTTNITCAILLSPGRGRGEGEVGQVSFVCDTCCKTGWAWHLFGENLGNDLRRFPSNCCRPSYVQCSIKLRNNFSLFLFFMFVFEWTFYLIHCWISDIKLLDILILMLSKQPLCDTHI